MSKSVNKVILIGHLGADPEIHRFENGGAATKIRIATSDTWKDKHNGEKKEHTEWHTVCFFNRLAEVAYDFLQKGSCVFVEGAIRTRKWTDNDNAVRYANEIIGKELQFLDSRKERKMDGDFENELDEEIPF